MNKQLQTTFLDHWGKYFPGADLPVIFFYSDDEKFSEYMPSKKGFTCMIGQLARARKGGVVAFSSDTIGCEGGIKYSGFPVELNPGLKFFLSCGIEGEYEGLRLKATPELVEKAEKTMPVPPAEGKYLVCKRLDGVEDQEEPDVIAWFSNSDVISALVGLAAFRRADRQCVISPQSSGCGSILSYPLGQRGQKEPRATLGMFDISARPYVGKDILSFAVPMDLFVPMVEDMDNSFLTTHQWGRIAGRTGE